MTLRIKLFAVIFVFVVALLLVVVLTSLASERERSSRERELRTALLEFAASLSSPGERVERTALFRDATLHPRVRAIAVYSVPDAAATDPVRERAWGPFGADPELAARAERAVRAAARTGETQVEGASAAVPTLVPRGSLAPGARPVASVVFVELRSEDFRGAGLSRASYVAILVAGTLLVLATWVLLDRLVVRPLREVVEAAGRVAVGDYSRPVPETGRDDEIARVIESFNAMMVDLDRVQGRLKDQMGDVLAVARRTQDSLVIAQRLAATGRLAAGIAHEVNNPLAGMLEAVRALQTREMPPAKREEYLALVEDGLRRVQATVSRILQFTPHNVAPRPIAMSEIVGPALALARHRAEELGVRVTVEGADEPAQVFGDPYELQQAVLNVILNALDALQDAARGEPALLLRTTADDRDVRLLVRDNGTGIREEDLPRVFDLFFTTKEPGKGTGLGLATAHKILTDHDGRMDLRSRPGEGVEIEFTLPRIRD